MIRLIDLTDNREVLQVLSLQQVSYRIEAEIIGFADIPPLMDSIQSLQRSGEIFYGYYMEGDLFGAVAYKRGGPLVVICRMMVHPFHFRRGIARRLLEFVQSAEADASRFAVSTGTANEPAVRLYEQNGFVPRGVREIARGITLTDFEKVR